MSFLRWVGKRGGAQDLLKTMHGPDLPESVKVLAKRAGIPKSTAQSYLDKFVGEKLVDKVKEGNCFEFFLTADGQLLVRRYLEARK